MEKDVSRDVEAGGRRPRVESRDPKPGIAKVISIHTTYHITRHFSYASRWAYEGALSPTGLEQAAQAEQHRSVLRLLSLLI